MTPNTAALVVLPGVVICLIAAAYGYLQRFRPPRPPIGVYRWSDIGFMIVSVVVAPFVYLALPRVVVAVLFGAVVGFAVQMTIAAIGGGRLGIAIAVVLVALTSAAAVSGHPVLVTTGTDVILLIALVGVTNLWVQSGMKALHVAALAGALTVYDLFATGLSDVTVRLAREMHGLPFAPVFALTGGHAAVSIGLGDLLMLVLYPLAVARSYGHRAGVTAAAVGAVIVGAIDLGFGLGLITTGVPFLTVLGPLIVAQQIYWRRKYPRERTVANWLETIPAADVQATQLPPISQALRATSADSGSPGSWLAIIGDQIVGRGVTPGRARRSAREAGHLVVPLVRQV